MTRTAPVASASASRIRTSVGMGTPDVGWVERSETHQ
jgi:hypothetical protein